jgi:hypothetical protein
VSTKGFLQTSFAAKLKSNQRMNLGRPGQCDPLSTTGGPLGKGDTLQSGCLTTCISQCPSPPVTLLGDLSFPGSKAAQAPADLCWDPSDPSRGSQVQHGKNKEAGFLLGLPLLSLVWGRVAQPARLSKQAGAEPHTRRHTH